MDREYENVNFEEDESQEIDAREVAWKLFEKTKDVNFYRLYSAINNENESEYIDEDDEELV